jgi:hypothetical protein
MVVGAVAPVVLTGGVGGAQAGDAGGSAPVAQSDTETTPTENDSTHHENPDEADEDGDIESVKDWLLGGILERLGDSVGNISQGQYDTAEDLLGDETQEYLGKYVDVAGDTEGGAGGSDDDDESGDDESDDDDEPKTEDEKTADTINETINEQENFTRSRQNYSELYQRYLTALDNGNIELARRLARRLAGLENRVNRTGRNLTERYREIENRTGIDTDEEREQIDQVVENVSNIQAEIENTLFRDTRITLDAYTETSSILDPISVRGQVVVENGSANATGPGNETPVTAGAVVLGGTGARTTVNESGVFTLEHRPVLLARGETTLTVEYRPPATSRYRGSTTAFETTVEGRQSTLEINGTPGSVSYGETVDIEASLAVGNRSIEDVPVAMSLGGTSLGSATTANDTTTISGVVPAGVDDGQRELRVALPFSGRALESANVTRTVQVEESDTRLTINVTRQTDNVTTLSETRLRVRGRLETVDGTPVSGQSLRIDVAGENIGSVRTGADGGFGQVVGMPDGLNVSNATVSRVPVNVSNATGRSFAVNASFGAEGANLAPANASEEATVFVAQPDDGSEESDLFVIAGGLLDLGTQWSEWLGSFGVVALAIAGLFLGVFGLDAPWWVLLGVLGVVVGFAGATLYLIVSRARDESAADGADEAEPAGSTGVTESDSGTEEDEAELPSLIEVALERLEAGASDAATEASYDAVRRRLLAGLGVAAGTHWELYRACQAAGWPDDQVTAIRRLTEAYEQAAFAPDSLSSDTAREAVATARDLLRDDDSASRSD